MKVYLWCRFQLNTMCGTRNSRGCTPPNFGCNKNEVAWRVNLITRNYSKKRFKMHNKMLNRKYQMAFLQNTWSNSGKKILKNYLIWQEFAFSKAYNHGQNIWQKVKTISKIRQDQKTFTLCFYHATYAFQREFALYTGWMARSSLLETGAISEV